MSKRKTITNWFEQYGNDIYLFLTYRTNMNDAEDLLQEVFIKALKNVKYFQGKSHPKTWLLSIARNVAIDSIRKKQAKKSKKVIPIDKDDVIYTEQTPATILEANEQEQEIYQCIQQLKENYRDVIVLRGIQALSVTDTARILNWSESKVTSTHYRARLALIKKLRRSESNAK